MLGTPISDGSPEVQNENGEMIAIVSDSSSVRGRFLSNRVLFTASSHEGLTHSSFYLAKPFVLFDSRWTPFEFENALKLIKLTQLFVQDQLIQKFVPTAEKMGVKSIYVLGQKIEGFRTFEEMVEDARSQNMALISPHPAMKDTLACLVFSSGTTGPPKGQ